MCGRFGFEDLTMYFESTFLALLDEIADAVPQTLTPRLNIAPTEDVLALLTRRVGDVPRRRLEMLRWSLVPPWAESVQLPYATFNARAETVAEKATFRDPWKRGQRCLIPADRFYEWEKTPSRPGGGKQCYALRMRDGGGFAFGGLWADWRDRAAARDGADAPPLGTCTILTTAPNALLAAFHDRSPVIVPPEHHAAWLDPATPFEALAPLLEPYPAEAMTATPIDAPQGTSRGARRAVRRGPRRPE